MTPARRLLLSSHVFVGFLLCSASGALADGITHQVTVINGLQVDRYSWPDSGGLTRTVSLKQEGNGNPGHGGYAIQMTYQLNGQTITVNADASGDGGFGYFVSHERSRDFTDGANDTIASHIFGVDDSPLGSGFPVVGEPLSLRDATRAAHRFTMTYGHYGTTFPIPKDQNGNDVQLTPTDPSKFAFYSMPITITWVFQSGTDYPRIDTTVDFNGILGPDLVNFDVRGPYGVMVFDNGNDGTVDGLTWGDRFQFVTTQSPPTRNSGWTWNAANNGARYSALTAGGFEMGFFEPTLFASSATADLYAAERDGTSTSYNGGRGCAFGETELIPCDFEWPYQSIQYSLPYDDNNGTTNFKKMAWGSSPFYGTGTSLPTVSDSAGTFETFNGFPGSLSLSYSTCIVLGVTIPAGLTKTAAAQPSQNCASEVVTAQAFHCGDFNGDRKADILWRNADGDVYIWLMNGLNIASSGPVASVTLDWQIAGVGDFNGNGKAGILWRNSNTGEVVIWLMNGTTLVSATSLGVVANAWQIAGVGDFDGDGKADILWRNANGNVEIWLMNGTSIKSFAPVAPVGLDWQIAGTGDFNGDGKADILWRNIDGDVFIWLMNGLSIASSGEVASVSSDWQIAGVGDFDGDGRADILWRHADGTVYEWLMNGLSISSLGSPAAPNNGWQIAGVGDFDGDHKADILWRYTDGTVYEWLMNGLSINSLGSPGNPALAWLVQ